jgi:hypothetical protein
LRFYRCDFLQFHDSQGYTILTLGFFSRLAFQHYNKIWQLQSAIFSIVYWYEIFEL